MIYKLTIKGKLDGLNKYIDACRTNQFKGSKVKSSNEHKVLYAIYEQLGRLRIKHPVYMKYHWIEPNKRRDKDNISSFGRKVIQDALVSSRVLENDGWAQIVGFSDSFSVDRENPRIEIEIEEM